MKSVYVAGVALALAAGLASANAADIRQPAPVVKAPAYVAPVFNWTGPYVGISGGYGWGDSDDFHGGAFPGPAGHDGGLIGGTLGYNWQMGPAVVGIEGDISWSGLEGGGTCGPNCRINNDWLGTVRGRLGYNGGRFMPYVTGGLAVGNIDARVAGNSTDSTKAGWTLGAGVEAQISGPWTAKVEYLYVDLGKSDNIPGTGGTRADFNTNIIRAGVNYKF